MTISVLKEPSLYCFIGNAISFEVETDSYGAVVVEIICKGESQMASYYPFKKGEIYKTKFDIAGYLYASLETEEYPQGEVVSILSDFSLPYQVKIGEDYIFNGTAFKGGIDNGTLAVLAKMEVDIFSFRLTEYSEQFLFTTRTHSNIIKVRETELYPFVFIHPGVDIVIKSESGNAITSAALAKDSICVLDIAAVRENFHEEYEELPNKIDIWISDTNAFSIQIVPKQVSEERYFIRFKNSLNAFEVVEVVGTAKHEPNISEPTIYQSLTEHGFYSDRRERLTIQDVLKVESGYKTKDEILFLRDLICSEETYFIYPDGFSFRCNVSVDKLAYLEKRVTPESVALIVTNENDSRYISPDFSAFFTKWILETGEWNDRGVWDDNSLWND